MRAPFAIALLTALFVLGCESGMDEPKEPVWGKQPCEECAMLLSDRRHGAQLVTAGEERLYFDDLGCMAAWTLEHPESVFHQWVRTVDTGEWIPAGRAGYRRVEHSPMGYGLVAVSDSGELAWSDVRKLVEAKLESR